MGFRAGFKRRAEIHSCVNVDTANIGMKKRKRKRKRGGYTAHLCLEMTFLGQPGDVC